MLAWRAATYHDAMQMVAKLPIDESYAARWLSISGGEPGGYVIREHVTEDGRSPYDSWAATLDEALAYGDAYGLSRDDWYSPSPVWVNAGPPVGFGGD